MTGKSEERMCDKNEVERNGKFLKDQKIDFITFGLVEERKERRIKAA